LQTPTAAQLQKGQTAIIEDINIDEIPLKLIEMGCLPGNAITLLQKAPFGDPLFFNINESKVAIRKKTAAYIFIQTENL
jgi:ferrous iron transport protein A